MKRARFLSPFLLVLVLGCDRKPGGTETAAGSAPGAPALPSVTAAPAAATPPPTAAKVLAQLKASGLPIRDEVVYTDANDTNHLLGRPHQYVAKAAWKDSRIKEDGEPGTDTGGTFEIFATDEDCTTRATYIDKVTQSSPLLAEYDYRKGLVLVRVSKTLTPTQAKEYEKALSSL